MNFHKLIILLFFVIFSFFSCSKKEKQNTSSKNKITLKSKKLIPEKVKIIPKKRLDTLNNTNVVAFLTEYGKQNSETKVLFKTRLGDITIKLYKDTPLHRASFIFLTKMGYFNTTCFHRVVPDFIAQGGNSENRTTADFRNKYKQYLIPSEFKRNHKHKRGALAAARQWENNPKKLSTPFEFYFIQKRKGEHHLDFEHTVFGEVIKGMPVIDEIISQKADTDEWPFIDVHITAQVIE